MSYNYYYNGYSYPYPFKKAFTYNLTTPAVNRPLSLTTVKNYLKIDISDTSQDDFLNLLIDSASFFGEKCTGRDFINKGYTTFRDTFCDCLELRRSKTSSITSIEYLKDDSFVLVDSGIYSFTDVNGFSNIFLLDGKSWPGDLDCRPQAIKIIFVAGYGADETSIPADIQIALLAHIAFMYENRGDCGCDLASEANLPATSKLVYGKYRIISIGKC